MCINRIGCLVAVAVALGAASKTPCHAQVRPWDVFSDTLSPSICDVVNAANAELAVLSDSGNFVIITGADVILQDTFVDFDGNVFDLGDPAGFIDFADDGDGFRTLWWLSITGRVIEIDGFTGEPFESVFLPEDLTDAACDACDFWDDPSVCLDSDGDGVLDIDDLCPNTPSGQDVDDLGCTRIDPGIIINLCGASNSLTLFLMCCGIVTLRFTFRPA